MHRGTDRISAASDRPFVIARWEFPGRADQVPHARHVLAAALQGCPVGADAVLMTSELITNAVVHSRSGRGGTFTVSATHRISDLRVEVTDAGGHWLADTGPAVDNGRGLLIVANIARAWGVTGDDSGRTVWFELDCP